VDNLWIRKSPSAIKPVNNWQIGLLIFLTPFVQFLIKKAFFRDFQSIKIHNENTEKHQKEKEKCHHTFKV